VKECRRLSTIRQADNQRIKTRIGWEKYEEKYIKGIKKRGKEIDRDL